MSFLIGAWVAVLIAIVFFTFGYCWYYGQGVLKQYLHVHDQTTALAQLCQRLGSRDESISTAESEHLTHAKSLPVQHQTASSDEEDERKSEPAINILPPITNGDGSTINKRISFINNIDEIAFPTSSSNGLICTITAGLGVFLTTSSRHTPHVFERVLARIHAVC
jgi:hypothetical protein